MQNFIDSNVYIKININYRIEQVHKRGLVYRDVKPENFLLGRKDSKQFNIIHLVDFGLATFYKDPVTGKHLPFKDMKTMTGTARYMSIHRKENYCSFA